MFESLKKSAYPDASGEDQPSEIARSAALLRALAAMDEREEIRGADSLAEIFLAENRNSSLKEPAMREWLLKNYLPYGAYAYSIAATAYFDHIVEQALKDNVPQIVILGAGYDSRPYRFSAHIGETRIFEVDDHATQQRKQELLLQANVPVPRQLTYVPVSDTDSTLEYLLFKAGFDKERLSLFVCEGVTYYLPPAEVDEIFNFIKLNSPAGSMICFDYKSVSPGMPDQGGMTEFKDIFQSASVEPAGFAIEEGKTGVFLAERDLMTLEHLTADELEKRYLTLRDGSLVGKVPARYCITYASLAG